ncbi:MAG TPA: MFS transporter [Anaerolineae bacterium]|nr:MFS transporter [Anaerolineae bacterium]
MKTSSVSRAAKSIERTYYLLLGLFWLATGLPIATGYLLAQARGLDLFQLGLVLAAYSLTIVLLEVPTGGLADAVGRKRVALLAYTCALLASVSFVFALSFPAMLLAFVLNGVGRALASGALDAWFVDSFQAADPNAKLQAALARAGSVSLLALAVGSLLGSALPRLFAGLGPEGTGVLTPLATPLVASAVAWIILVTLAALLVREGAPPAGAPARTRSWREGARRVPGMIRTGLALSRRNPTILRLLAISFASGLVLVSLEALWQPHFAGLLGGSEGRSLLFGLIMGGNFIAGTAGNLLSTPLLRLLKGRYGLVAALFQGLRGVGLVLLALQVAPVPAVLLFWWVYLGMGVVNSPHATLMNAQIPAEHRSSMLSIESLVAYLGSILGSAGLSYLAEQTSVGVAWFAGGVIVVLSLGLYLSIDALPRGEEERHVARLTLVEPDQAPDAG